MRLVIFFAILWMNDATFAQIRSRSKSKPKAVKPNSLCSLEPTDTNSIRCFCTKDKYQVLSAECWIFEPVNKDSLIWRLIVETQPYLSDFSIIASHQGQLKSIPPQFLQKMLFMRNFTISFALLDKLEKHVLANSTSIQKLTLCKNQIEILENFSIANLLSLKELDLSGNRIRSIPNYVFFNVPELKYVRLNSNNISKIEDKAFSSLGNVLELDLSENYICDINNLTFFGLSKLKVMDLSVNKIVNLVSSVFSELWDIEELYLDDNYIEFISNRAFDGLRFLKTLSLVNNRLTRFPAGLFASVFTLVNLDLSNNRLETLVFDSIEQFYNNLLHNGTIDMKGNRFSCDCRLDWVYSLHDKTAQAHIRNSLEELQCSMNADKTTVTTEVVEHLICSPSLFSNSIEETLDQNDYYDKENEADSSGKAFLMSIPLKDLPCPAEYRPTPITVKQGSPSGVEIVDSGSSRKIPFYSTIFLIIFSL
ncbi:connectin [Diorhabda carinulata]|uniref:connectin n=1 Tax=Diorhabda carinulata TaxID=1163345 RepID=UPI0025A0B7C2|nr:connectin [Diorhabda carinulata]XP_057656261.1 connectin [Diorhabda carinulata]XP_057656262.1 connectin [Diorhabda carinulata]